MSRLEELQFTLYTNIPFRNVLLLNTAKCVVPHTLSWGRLPCKYIHCSMFGLHHVLFYIITWLWTIILLQEADPERTVQFLHILLNNLCSLLVRPCVTGESGKLSLFSPPSLPPLSYFSHSQFLVYQIWWLFNDPQKFFLLFHTVALSILTPSPPFWQHFAKFLCACM